MRRGWSTSNPTLETLLLFAIWWVWMYTTWAMNWLDPETLCRLMLVGIMLGAIVTSAALPEAFSGRGLAFALPYVLIQIERMIVAIWAVREPGPANFVRIVIWFCVSRSQWLAGNFAAFHPFLNPAALRVIATVAAAVIAAWWRMFPTGRDPGAG